MHMRLNKKIFFSFLLSIAFFSLAQANKIKKPQLMVYGSGFEALTAALQSAKSNVPTLWVIEESGILPNLPAEHFEVVGNENLDGGMWMDLLMQLANAEQPSDSIAYIQKKSINPRLLRNIVEEWISAEKQLTLLTKTSIDKIDKKRSVWEVQLSDKHKYKVRSIVDASEEQKLVSKQFPGEEYTPILATEKMQIQDFRTLLGNAELDGKAHAIRFQNLKEAEHQGLYGLGILHEMGIEIKETAFIPLRMSFGQALGATAAYTAFFKTTIDKVDIRLLQDELMTFGARLLPYQDIAIEDPNYKTLQKFSLSGILIGEQHGDSYQLGKNKEVAQEEVREVFDQMHARSKVWFLDHPIDVFTWKDALDYIGFVSFRGAELEKNIQKDFNDVLHFSGEYEEDRKINRYEFGTILSVYDNPFRIKIDQKGKILR